MIQHTWIPQVGVTTEFTRDDAIFRLLTGSIEGLGDPKTDDFVQEQALIDGQLFSGYRAKARDCFWPVMVDATLGDWESQQALFWQSLVPGAYGVWRVTAPSGNYRDLTCRYVPSDYTPIVDPSKQAIEVIGINLVADDPWWRGPVVEKEFQTGETPLPFFATSGGVLNLMSANTVDSATITNPGEIPAWSTFTIVGPSTAFDIRFFSATEGAARISGTVDVPDGWRLVINTDPTAQSVRLYDSDGNWTNVFSQLDNIGFTPIAAGNDVPLYITLNGAGSMLVSFSPGYRRAY